MKVVLADAALLRCVDTLRASMPADVVLVAGPSLADATVRFHLADATVLISSTVTPEVVAAAPALRLVHVAGTGTDRIDLGTAKDRITVQTTGHHARSIAEFVVAGLVVLNRRLLTQDAALRKGTWASPVYDPTLPLARTLGGAIVTMLGFGTIGQQVWQALRGFGAEGIAVTDTTSVDPAVHGLLSAVSGASGLAGALTASDVVVVSVPLRRGTKDMIGRRELDQLGGDGVLVNVARADIVQEEALYEALRNGQIRGAVLDVWYRYPASDDRGLPATLPFGSLSNVVMSPHASGVTQETFEARAIDIGRAITRLYTGEDANSPNS